MWEVITTLRQAKPSPLETGPETVEGEVKGGLAESSRVKTATEIFAGPAHGHLGTARTRQIAIFPSS